MGEADKVLVLDSGSTDRTGQIASACGASVVTRAMTDFADQRNYAASLAKTDWVLHLDADERVTPALWKEITRAVAAPGYDGFLIPTLNNVFGAPLRHGGWYPQYHLRLQRPSRGRWTGSVHETVALEGRVGTLHEPIIHFGHPDLGTFLSKIDRYTTIEAARLHRPILLLSLLAVFEPPTYFLYKYAFQRGFLDGWRGLVAALLLSFYRCLTYLKAVERTVRLDSPR